MNEELIVATMCSLVCVVCMYHSFVFCFRYTMKNIEAMSPWIFIEWTVLFIVHAITLVVSLAGTIVFSKNVFFLLVL